MNKYKKNNHSSKTKTGRPNRPNQGGKRPARSGRGVSKLDPSLLVKEASKNTEKDFRADRKIDALPVDPRLIDLLQKKGFERPSEIQDRTLEHLLKGKNLLGIAQTGTGKTAAFLVPIIDQLLQIKNRSQSYALIIVPTRELATQVSEEFKSMTKGLGLFSACFIGGTNINRDVQALRRQSHVVIGTPGRLLDLQNRRVLDFRQFHTLVLDEFDRMLDMGFRKDMDRIINMMHSRRQTMLFSATLDHSQQSIIDEILEDPITVKVSTGQTSGDNIDQSVIRLSEGQDKYSILLDILLQDECTKVLLFEETKHKVSRLSMKLNKSGIKSDQIQGNKSQNARERALKAFRDGKIKVLVATDVAARGIDVSDVTHVINYQLPMTYDSYIHRIGRTGRAGQVGKAITFVDPKSTAK